jgi:predicted metal-dependent HD superfamily phosphohydrolase
MVNNTQCSPLEVTVPHVLDLCGLREGLEDFLKKLDAPKRNILPVVEYLWAHYGAPERYYHNLAHIDHCMRELEWIRERFHISNVDHAELQAAKLALWYHDLVYDPKLHNNEELSCSILCAHAGELRLHAGLVDQAYRAIMATRHKAVPVNPIDKYVVDIDLAILHAPEPLFDTYERQVREEYAFVDDVTWTVGRIKVLQEFLDREWIYSTPMFRRRYEGDARANLKRSIARLAQGEVLRMVR